MSGLHTGSLVIGLLCLAGAVVGLFALPGRDVHTSEDALVDAVPVAA